MTNLNTEDNNHIRKLENSLHNVQEVMKVENVDDASRDVIGDGVS